MSTFPVYYGKGVAVANQSAVSPNYPASITNNQVALMAIETANEAVAIIPTGWTQILSLGTGTPGTVGSVMLTVLGKRLTGSETAQSIGDSGDHQCGRILVFDGCVTAGDPWVVITSDIQPSPDTTVEIPGGTTPVDQCLVVLFAAHAIDSATAQVSGETHPDLANLVDLTEVNASSGVGGGVWVGTGEKATAGVFGAMTATLATSSAQVRASIALKPIASPEPGVGSLVLTGLAPTVLTSRVAQPGVGALTITGLEPNVVTAAGQAHPGVGSLVLTGLAPTVVGLSGQVASPDVGGLVITSFAPRVIVGKYFVSNTPGEEGDDSADGSLATPWLTLSKLSSGAAFLAPGNTVGLRYGSSFPETLTIKTVGNAGGTSGHPITFTAYGDDSLTRPIITGAELTSGWVFDTAVADGDRWRLVGTLGYTPQYAFRETGTVGIGTVRNLRAQASVAAVTALDDWRNDVATLTVYVVVGTGEVPEVDVNIHLTSRINNILPTTGGEDYITLQNLICRFSNGTSGSHHSLEFAQDTQAANGWVMDNLLQEWGFNGLTFGGQGTNDFSQTRLFTMRDCVWRYNRAHGAQCTYLTAGSSVIGCDFESNGRQGLGIAMRNGTIADCTFHRNARAAAKWTSAATYQQFDAGLYVVGQEPPGAPAFVTAGSNLIVDCAATGNTFKGFATDTLCDNNRFLRCLSTLNGVFGFFFEGGTDSSAYGNELDHCTAWGNVNAGFSVYNGHGGFTVKNCQLGYNCTGGNASDATVAFITLAWLPDTAPIYKRTHLRYDPVNLKASGGTMLTRVANRAAMTAGTWAYDAGTETGYAWDHGSGVITTCYGEPVWTMDGNDYTPSGSLVVGHNIMNYAGVTSSVITSLLSSIRSVTGQELNGQQDDPLYVDAANGDFRLTVPESPSIDTGVVIPGVNDVTSGYYRAYVGVAPDVGYIEGPEVISDPIPVPEGAGPFVSVAGTPASVTVQWPAHQTGWVGLLVIESDNSGTAPGNSAPQIVLDTPSGFLSTIPMSPRGTSSSLTGTRLETYWCRATSGAMADVVLHAPTNHVSAQIYAFSGCIPTGNPYNVGTGDTLITADTAVAIPGTTTTVPNCLIVAISSHYTDTAVAQFSAPVNAALSSVTLIGNVSHTDGDGGGFAVIAGGKAVKGPYGTTTATLATASKQGRLSVALQPLRHAGIAPGVGQLILTGLEPSVLINPVNPVMTPGIGSVVLTGLAPSVGAPRVIQPAVGALVLTGLAPTVLVVGNPALVTPGVGQLIITGLAPTVVQPDVYAWFPGDDSYRPGRRYEDIGKEHPKKKKRKRKKPERIPTPLQPLAMPFPMPLVLPPAPLSLPPAMFPAPGPLPVHPPRVVVPPPVVPPPPPESADPSEYANVPIDPEDEARAMALLMKLIGH